MPPRLTPDNVADVLERFTLVFEYVTLALREATKAALERRYWARRLP